LNGLAGRRVIVTRTQEQASELAERLQQAGATPILFSTIEIVEPADGGAALAAAAGRAGDYSWIVFTSPNAVGRAAPFIVDPGEARIAAVGPGTARALTMAGLVPDLVASRHVAEGLLEEFPPPPPGSAARVLLPQAAGARRVLADGLRTIGYQADVVEAYRTVTAQPSGEQLAAIRRADAITFTSSSTVQGFLAAAGRDLVPPVVACMGPVTAATAGEMGLAVTVVAEEHTVAGLVTALVRLVDW
jgi:uroporphyrinogen-III synthase